MSNAICCADGASEGFTLLEVMIAISLLAIGLIALLGLLGRSLEIQNQAREIRIDFELAGELATLYNIDSRQARQESLADIKHRYPHRQFERVSQPTLHPSVRRVEIRVYRGSPQGEPVYRLEKFIAVDAE